MKYQGKQGIVRVEENGIVAAGSRFSDAILLALSEDADLELSFALSGRSVDFFQENLNFLEKRLDKSIVA